MKTIQKEKNRELQNECSGITNSTLSGVEIIKRIGKRKSIDTWVESFIGQVRAGGDTFQQDTFLLINFSHMTRSFPTSLTISGRDVMDLSALPSLSHAQLLQILSHVVPASLLWPAWACCPARHFLLLYALSFLSPPVLLPLSAPSPFLLLSFFPASSLSSLFLASQGVCSKWLCPT